MASIRPRHLTPTNISGNVDAEVWYYRRQKTDEVVVEVRDRHGAHIATVQATIRHPKKKGDE